MKNYDYWRDFVMTGKIDDYLNYIACTREESFVNFDNVVNIKEEGDFHAGSNNCDGNGSISHAGWRL
ncbi:MAG: hypothetical protein PHC56_03585 [Herbinix sp.]|nr:hypothetical protein [Herbinix sp.]